MKILVTGSSGFIGTHLVGFFLRKGWSVHGLDRKYPVASEHRGHFHSCDLLDSSALTRIVSELAPDAVIHLAARTDLEELKDLERYAANTTGVENLISAIQATPSIRRAVFTSSQLVCRPGYLPNNETDYAPHTLYGQSKVLTEQIVRRSADNSCAWCLVRPTTVWGPGMSAHYCRFLRLIQQGRYRHIGHRALLKSYSYVGNITFQYHKLIEAPAERIHGKTFYLADYEPLSLRAWADTLQRELGAPPIRTLPEPIAKVAAHLGDLLNTAGWRSFPFNTFRIKNILTEYVFDLSATETICGSLPFGMEEGVRTTARWFASLPV